MFHAASVAEKVGRCAISSSGGGLSKDEFVDAISKRASEHAKGGGKDESIVKVFPLGEEATSLKLSRVRSSVC